MPLVFSINARLLCPGASVRHLPEHAKGWDSAAGGLQGASYQVRNRADKRQQLSILSDVTAYFSPVEMAAVMGPSGSGGARSPRAFSLLSTSLLSGPSYAAAVQECMTWLASHPGLVL